MPPKEKVSKKNVPVNKLLPSYHIEADGTGGFLSILISGVFGIAEFSSENIKLLTKKESVRIFGKDMRLSVLERKTVEITGKIENITFPAKVKRGDWNET